MIKFSEVIREIESELKFEYLPGAIRWADKEFDGAWSKAIDRFDLAITACNQRSDWHSLELEAEHYKRVILSLIAKFKAHKNLDDAENFLSSLRVHV